MNDVNHKRLTKHLRSRIKAEEIVARVKIREGNEGYKVISVMVPTYDARFAAAEIHKFCVAAKAIGLTLVRGAAIEPYHQEKLTDKQQWDFYLLPPRHSNR